MTTSMQLIDIKILFNCHCRLLIQRCILPPVYKMYVRVVKIDSFVCVMLWKPTRRNASVAELYCRGGRTLCVVSCQSSGVSKFYLIAACVHLYLVVSGNKFQRTEVVLYVLADITCPTERGYVFDECGSPCKRTCANRNLPPDEIDRQCYLPCVSRCQCVAGKVEHDGRCINPSLCPDHISAVDLHVGR